MGRRPTRASPGGVQEIDGYVVIDKPAGITSHDVVARARRLLATRRIGHAGTLDPGATGVLVLGVGRATRLLRFVSDQPKSYRGEIVFATTTSTLDDAGEITGRFEMPNLEPERISLVARRFVGTIKQIPPMVSAIKVDGTRLYELARKGIEVERAPRSVTITRFDLEPTKDRFVFSFVVDCSSGTYVRSLAADLGAALGGGAHLRRLRREGIGPFRLDGAVVLDALSRDDVAPSLGLVRHLDRIVVDDRLITDIAHGKIFERRALEVVGDGPWALQSKDARLLGVYESWTTERIKPAVVLLDADELERSKSADPELTPLTKDSPDGR
ncbi:MAG TPA: tRNA pseudouridine(55) synthase TruB [Acidimicrobiales bacterium]|nr:tRNA pseudouridine(55) synthase TruB [Acidimicrobiales bacterium]